MFLSATIKEIEQLNLREKPQQMKNEWKNAVRFMGTDVTITVSPYIDSIGRECFAGNTRLRKISFEPSQLLSVEGLAFTAVKIAEIALPVSSRLDCIRFRMAHCDNATPSPVKENRQI
jgi:hypothetical protein